MRLVCCATNYLSFTRSRELMWFYWNIQLAFKVIRKCEALAVSSGEDVKIPYLRPCMSETHIQSLLPTRH